MPDKLKLMVASTVYQFEDSLEQICAVLNGFGYEVWNSHIGTIPVDPTLSNLENCVSAVKNCDLFLGIVRSQYGSGVVGDISITHAECREAVRLRIPRWFLAHRDDVARFFRTHFFRFFSYSLLCLKPLGTSPQTPKVFTQR